MSVVLPSALRPVRTVFYLLFFFPRMYTQKQQQNSAYICTAKAVVFSNYLITHIFKLLFNPRVKCPQQ